MDGRRYYWLPGSVPVARKDKLGMGGGPVSILLLGSAYLIGFVPGLLASWLTVRRYTTSVSGPRLALALGTARAATALVAGILVPALLALLGLVLAYVAQSLSTTVGLLIPAVLGGWVTNDAPGWVGSAAVCATWLYYVSTLRIVERSEIKIVRRYYRDVTEKHTTEAIAAGTRVAYAVQAVIAIIVWWDVHKALFSG